MKFYSKQNVFDAALDRFRFIFDEFPEVVVGFSGGKDSTVCLNLALRVAEEKGRLPLKVMFLDQEAEWQTVIDFARKVSEDPRIDFRWYQMPIRIENATSGNDSYLITWEPGKEWMREKEPNSITENIYGTEIFYELFAAIFAKDFPGQKACYISGVRCEESPTRFVALTYHQTYKHITYGKILNKAEQQFSFYPLYDWSYTDVWKSIHENGWPYCQVYDYMYMHGVNLNDMRVSNLNHETALHALYFLPEIESETWNRLTKRLAGINSARQLGKSNFISPPKDLPYMFTSWIEYRDYLLKNLITDPVIFDTMRKKFEHMDKKYREIKSIEDMYRVQISTILSNDSWLTKVNNWERRPEVNTWRKWQRGLIPKLTQSNKYITG